MEKGKQYLCVTKQESATADFQLRNEEDEILCVTKQKSTTADFQLRNEGGEQIENCPPRRVHRAHK